MGGTNPTTEHKNLKIKRTFQREYQQIKGTFERDYLQIFKPISDFKIRVEFWA